MHERGGESSDAYAHVVANFGDRLRLIECDAGIQWIIQRRLRNRGAIWEGVWFCHTRAGLERYFEGADRRDQLEALGWLCLPERFPERGGVTSADAGHARFEEPPAPGQRPDDKSVVTVPAEAPRAHPLLTDGILSDWKPTAKTIDPNFPEMPEFLRRV